MSDRVYTTHEIYPARRRTRTAIRTAARNPYRGERGGGCPAAGFESPPVQNERSGDWAGVRRAGFESPAAAAPERRYDRRMPDFVRLSVNVNKGTAAALQDIAAKRGESVTETVRRATAVLKLLEDETAARAAR